MKYWCCFAAALTLFAPAIRAESKNPADYPMRVHIFRRSETTFYRNRQAEETKGEGRANLFEGGEPKGVDFEFECDKKLQTSPGFETFPAKWRKQNAELVILQPQFGMPGSFDTCRLKVEMKDFAYISRNGNLTTEPTAAYKTWMTKHEYDPEHGKNFPVAIAPGGPNAQGPPASLQQGGPSPSAAPPQP